ncbi:MAG: hypothetical protein DI535_11560 [Citrobacter freundii]|nr:MAG: hypothetical protein DI535_11560 [Citrobacter freundii]
MNKSAKSAGCVRRSEAEEETLRQAFKPETTQSFASDRLVSVFIFSFFAQTIARFFNSFIFYFHRKALKNTE